MKIKLSIFALAAFFLLLFACENKAKQQKAPLKTAAQELYLQKGQGIAIATFAALGGALQKAIQTGGVPQALDYCAVNALPITDSLAQAEHAVIRRTSLKLRNPKNKATTAELKVLKAYEAQEKNGESLKPMVEQIGKDSIAFYAPIRVNAFCLQCHGTVGQELASENYVLIKEKYPQDQATAFSDGALRGIWSIKFEKNEAN